MIVNIKIVKSRRDVVAICDLDLIGKTFEKDKFQLDIKESFFKGEEFDESQSLILLERMLREDATFYIVGKEAIRICLKAGVIENDNVSEIQGIPFALVLL